MITYRRRRPPLYRMARYLRWGALVAAVLVVLFLISTAVSAALFVSHLSGSVSGGRLSSFNYTPSGGFTAAFAVNVTNDGYYPLVLDLTGVANTPQGPVVPYVSTGAVTFAPGGQTTVFGLSLHIPEATITSDADRLLVYNTPIAGDFWFNGSYAWIYQFGLSVAANGTWGAPFANLTVQPNTPVTANQQTTVPVRVSFTNNAIFSDTGNFTFQVVDSGVNCGPPAELFVNTPSHQSFAGEVNITGPSSCMVPGAVVTTTSPLGNFSLMSVRLG